MQIMHKGNPTTVVLSVGKDGFLRVWNLNNRLCLCALSCQVTEAYCLHVDESKQVVYVGTNKEDVVEVEFPEDGVCRIRGVFKKKSFARTIQIIQEHSILYIVNADKSIESYSILSRKEVEARKKRVLSRKKKALAENAEGKKQEGKQMEEQEGRRME